MSRPPSGVMRRSKRARPVLDTQLQSSENGFDDIVAAKYLENIRMANNSTMSHSGFQSASSSIRHLYAASPTFEFPNYSKFEDGRTAYIDLPKGFALNRRPTSAPSHKRNLTETYGANSRPSSAKSNRSIGKTRRAKPIYKRTTAIIVARAFKNGDRSISCKAFGATLSQFLECCTERLKLTAAGRRVFLDDGKEVFRVKDVPKWAEVFVSTGEGFKNPVEEARQFSSEVGSLNWTVNGLVWSNDSRKHSTHPMISRRLRRQLKSDKKRVLVFANGMGVNGVEIIADPSRIDDFLHDCTTRLNLKSFARILYDWEGKTIKTLSDVPVLDPCLQTTNSPVIGPLWVSWGLGFSPTGVATFLKGLIQYTKTKLQETKRFRSQLDLVLGSKEEREAVTFSSILSMNHDEVNEAVQVVEEDLGKFVAAVERLKEQYKKVERRAEIEKDKSSMHKFSLQHVQPITDVEWKERNLKFLNNILHFNVYENGNNTKWVQINFDRASAERGVPTNDLNETLMKMLLDQISCCGLRSTVNKQTALKALPQKLYNEFGVELSFDNLSDGMSFWVSYGEPWRPNKGFLLSITYDKLVFHSHEGKTSLALGQIAAAELKDRERGANWEVVESVPQDFPTETEQSITANEDEFFPYSHLLQSKVGEPMLLWPDLSMKESIKKSVQKDDRKAEPAPKPPACGLLSQESQCWLFHTDGTVCPKSMPKLALSLLDVPINTFLRYPFQQHAAEVALTGKLIGLQKRNGSSGQFWIFHEDGTISPSSDPNLLVTFIGHTKDAAAMLPVEVIPCAIKCYVAACQKLEQRHAVAQRWSIKQEKMENLGQWKHTKLNNPDWKKLALSWPSDSEGNLNKDYDWPMEGSLLPYAPVTTCEKANAATYSPLRLMVVRNGVSDLQRTQSLVGPDLSNMLKDGDGKLRSNKRCQEPADITADVNLHVLKLEFTLFLERCTQVLDLPLSARRLFDLEGQEHFVLRSLKRDQLVYVSCGEVWKNPKLSKTEQQRQLLLTNLSSDIQQMEQYAALRNPTGLVVEVESLQDGARVFINEVNMKNLKPEKVERDEEAEKRKQLNAHQMSHYDNDKKGKTLRWEWEKLANKSLDFEDFVTKSLQIRSSQTLRPPRCELQKFLFRDGFLACQSNPDFVLATSEENGKLQPVTLQRKKLEDILQRWTISDQVISSKNNANMVLTVTMPPVLSDSLAMSYAGSSISLQPRKANGLGRANQCWKVDVQHGIIEAFCSSERDKEITGANQASICSCAVVGNQAKIDQSGYEVKIPVGKDRQLSKLTVCISCAHGMRGRYRLERILQSAESTCAMGNAQVLGIPHFGSFKCLNGKVDLSTSECLPTIEKWKQELASLKEESSVRKMAKKLFAARSPMILKIKIYKNGEGRLGISHNIIGSSVNGIMQEAARKLELTKAPRRLYTEDGMLVLNVEDLVEWAQVKCVRDAQKKGKYSVEKNEQFQVQEENKITSTFKEEETAIIGFAAEEQPAEYDVIWRSVAVIPNPSEQVPFDGYVTQWDFFGSEKGIIRLIVVRPDERNPMDFQLVQQVEMEVPQQGQYTIDVTLVMDNKKGVPVKKGDLIGFFCPGKAVLSYEVSDEQDEYPLWHSVEDDISNGEVLRMDRWMQQGTRRYGMNVTIISDADADAEDIDMQERTKPIPLPDEKWAQIEKPSAELISKCPIELWVSCGEMFVSPQVVQKRHEVYEKSREQRAKLAHELDEEKHVYRHMKGRRLDGRLKVSSTASSKADLPVFSQGKWIRPTSSEARKAQKIVELEKNLQDIKLQSKMKSNFIIHEERGLYNQPNTKRVNIFPSGESLNEAAVIWGDTVESLIEHANRRLNMAKVGRYVYDLNGKMIKTIGDIERDQYLCISDSKTFSMPKNNLQQMQIKADWSRTRKLHGESATDITVSPQQNNNSLYVDPYAPPPLIVNQDTGEL